MGTTSFPETPLNADLQKVIINLNTIAEELDQVFSNIDTKNIREIAGWLASRYKLQSKDGDVGFNTQDTAVDDIRIWAGDAMNGAPKFKVTKAGIMTAVAALILSAAGYPRIELNSTDTLLSAFADIDDYLSISPTSGGAPSIGWTAAGDTSGYIGSSATLMTILALNDALMLLQADGNMTIRSFGSVDLDPATDLKINGAAGRTASLTYVKNIVPDGFGGFTAFNGTLTFTKGILTSYT
jgi:hypothetical protein